jgi:hypothetical protein
VNPYLDVRGHANGDKPYVGLVMRNIKLPDGRTGDAVVAARRPGSYTGADPSRTIEYEPIKKGKTFDVLWELQKPGGKQSLIPVTLNERAMKTAVLPAGKKASIPVPSKAVRGMVILESHE